MKKVCVLGLGYIGLPTASILATKGYKVIGVDIDEDLIANLQQGKLSIAEPDLDTIVHAALFSKNLTVSIKPAEANVFIISVPTPIDENKKADLRCVISAGESIASIIRQGNVVILESTVPPGTAVEILQPILEKSGLRAGDDFSLAFSPERVLPGQLVYELVENDRVIGGIDDKSSELAKEIYKSFVKGKINITDIRTAEMVKLMENTFRDVNIALANEFAIIAEQLGVNIWEAIGLANQHPRVNFMKPGPGVGGHCIAVDPWFIVEKAPNNSKLIRKTREINDQMPILVANMVNKILNFKKKPKLSIFGMTYKGDVSDIRESPSIKVIQELVTKGFDISLYDPFVQFYPKFNNILSKTVEESVENSDCILILTEHKLFGEIIPDNVGKLMRSKLVIDTRNCVEHALWRKSGFKTFVLGVNFLDLNLQ